MSAEAVQVWIAWCDECGWESETDDSQEYVERLADKHNAERHPQGEDAPPIPTPREEYQLELDAIVEAFRAG